jgi:hypothetical protein
METKRLSFEEMEAIQGGLTRSAPCWLRAAGLFASGVAITAAIVDCGVGVLALPAWVKEYYDYLNDCYPQLMS